jgi:hypothetical protein
MATNNSSSWRTFEDAVRAIVTQHGDFFGLGAVAAGPGQVKGESGFIWNIEVIGYAAAHEKLVMFEVRRKTTRNIEPGEAGELALRIQDTGAEKGYFVTPLSRGLSRGAKKVADFRQIGHIQVSADSTPENYIMRCIEQVFVGLTNRVTFNGVVEFEILNPDGTPIKKCLE